MAKIIREKIDMAFWQKTNLSDIEHKKIRKMGFRNSN